MKAFHIGDLHLGKRVYEFSMLEEQKELIEQILQKIDEEQPDVLFMTGDIYDKPIPPVEAVCLLDSFLTELSNRKLHTYIIAGNHDSAQRLEFGNALMAKGNVFICGNPDKTIVSYKEEDAYGEVYIHLLPFFKPAHVNGLLNTAAVSYQEAAELLLAENAVDTTKRNILLAHQFVSWKGVVERSDSETASVGGVDEIGSEIFADFDYVALGHLHSPQKVGRDTVRYAGSPMPYSFSEVRQQKGITVAELREKGVCEIDFIPLETTKKFRELKGPLAEILQAAKADDRKEDYIRCILTDTEALFDPVGQIRSVYPNLMTLEREQQMQKRQLDLVMETDELQPNELFADFFEKQTGKALTEEQQSILQNIWEGLEELQ